MQSHTPARLNIEQARNQAKDLLKALKSRDRAAALRFRIAIPQIGTYSDDQVFSAKLALHDAQRVIAIEHGRRSWQELVAHVRQSIEPPYSVDDLIAFFEAVKNRDSNGVRRALDAQPALIDARLLDDNYMLEGEAFREAIRNDPHPVSTRTRTALHLVSTGFFRNATPDVLEVARVLVERGSDVNNVGWDGNNNLSAPISLASWEGGLDMMRLLLDAGADVSGEHGVAALETAASHDNVDRYNLLEEYGAPVTAWSLVEMGLTDRIAGLVERDPGLLTQRDENGYTLLQTAAARGAKDPSLVESGREIVRALVRRGTEMDVFTAASMNDVDRLKKILDDNPDSADSRLDDGANPLCFATWSGSHEALEMLLKAGAAPDVQYIQYGNSVPPLRIAAGADDTVSCRLLLEHGAAPTDEAVNAATWRTKDPECVKLLLDYGGNPNPTSDGFGAINWAAWEAQTVAVKALLDRGADPNHRASAWAGTGPLHFAVSAGSRAPAERVTDTIVALLDAGSDVNLVDENGNTPLDAAISRENHTAADLLREYGGQRWQDLVAHVRRGIDPPYSVEELIAFFEAVKNRDADGVRRALDAQPALIDARLLDGNYMLEGDAFREAIRNDPHPVSTKTRTALHLVSTGFFRNATPEVLEVARVLVERGSDVNNVGWDGNNDLCAPITLASWEGGLDMMRLLLDAGADVSGEHGVAALETAAHHDSVDRYNLLEEYGAPVTAWSLVEMGLTDRIIDLVERDPGVLTQRRDDGYSLLQTAAARGDSNPALMESGREIVRALVRSGAEMDAFTAAAMNDVDGLSRILGNDPGAADSRLSNGASPVCFAAWGISHEALEMLLKAGADPNVSYGNAMSPLRRAAFYNDTVSCRLLLEHGAVPTDAAVNAAAWRNKDPECVKVLLDYGGSPNPGGDGFGAINWAAWAAQTEAVKALLERGADPNHGATEWAVGGPLHFAAFAGSRAPDERVTDTIVALLNAGSDVNLVDENGNTPLDAAIDRENHAAADLLREHGGKTNRELKTTNMDTTKAVERFKRHWTIGKAELPELTANEQLLITAATGEDRKRWDAVHTPDIALITEILTEEPTVLDRIGEHLLNVVVDLRGCGEVARLLLDRGVPFEIDPLSYNVLHNAAYRGAADTLQAVFESGKADATCVSVEKPHVGWPDNITLMYWAAVPGRVEVARLLIEYGVGVHHELPIKGNGERGVTSLHEALAPSQGREKQERFEGRREVARILIEDGAYYDVHSACALNDTARLQELIDEDVEVVNDDEHYGMTPLHWAARAGSMECAEILLERGVLVNPLNKARRTPLQLAAEADQADMIRLLARHNADLNTQDRKGRTPLHRATYEGCVEAAEALLEVGADSTVLNKNGKIAFEIARKDAKYFKTRA